MEGLTYKVYLDKYPISPRENDNLGTMICFHKRYKIGDCHGYVHSNYNSWDELEKEIIKDLKGAIILPLYLYDHSGLTISTKPFSCPWDSGKVGFILVSLEKIRSEFSWKYVNKKRIEKILSYLNLEVEEYNSYLTGEVYAWTTYDKDGNEAESCCGYYSKEHAIEDVKRCLEWKE